MKRLKKHKVITTLACLVIIAGIITGIVLIRWNRNKSRVNAGAQNQSFINLEKMDLTESISATGTIASNETRSVSAKMSDVQVEQVKAAVGDTVKKGDVLVTFEKEDLEDALEEAQEALEDARESASEEVTQAQKQLTSARETYQEEKANLSKQVANAKKEWTEAKKTLKKLKKQLNKATNQQDKATLQEQVTKAEEAVSQAKSAYQTAKTNQSSTNRQNLSNVENAESTVSTADSNGDKNISEAQKQVEQAEENLAKCEITAPIAGVVTAVNVEAGDTYSGGSLIQIDDTSSYTVTTSVDEYDISDVSEGQRVVILTEATDETELEGEITFVAPSTGSTSQTSGTSQTADASGMTSSTSGSDGYEVQIAVKTEDERLRMGLTAKCSIILEEAEDVFAVPYDAVHEAEDGTNFIYVREDGTQSSGAEQESDIASEDTEEVRGRTGTEQKQEGSTAVRKITVTKGMESDYYVAIESDELEEGMQVVMETDVTADSSDSNSDSSDAQSDSFFGQGNGMPGGGSAPGGSAPGGGASRGGAPGSGGSR